MVLDSHWVEWGALKSVGTLGHTGRYGGGVGPHLRSESRDTVHIEVLWELGEYCEYVSVTEVNDRNEVGGYVCGKFKIPVLSKLQWLHLGSP